MGTSILLPMCRIESLYHYSSQCSSRALIDEQGHGLICMLTSTQRPTLALFRRCVMIPPAYLIIPPGLCLTVTNSRPALPGFLRQRQSLPERGAPHRVECPYAYLASRRSLRRSGGFVRRSYLQPLLPLPRGRRRRHRRRTLRYPSMMRGCKATAVKGKKKQRAPPPNLAVRRSLFRVLALVALVARWTLRRRSEGH